MRNKLYSLATTIGCSIYFLACGASTLALPTDAQQKITIDADNSKTDVKNGVQTHTGNVFLQQGSLKISSDQLIIHSKEQQFESFVATGSPTTFEQQLELDQAPVKASGDRFELSYSGDNQVLVISGTAVLQQENSTVTCDKIIYNLTTGDFEFDKSNTNTQCRMNFIPPAQNGDAAPAE